MKNYKSKITKILIAGAVMLLTVQIFAAPSADDIAKKHFSLKKADDLNFQITMILINKHKDKKVRKFEMRAKETKEGRNSFVEFKEPAEVAGTKFLTIGHRDSSDEQRLYLPALGKVQRISSSSKNKRFVGSDLFYYDMEERYFGDFSYKFIKEDSFSDMDFYVIEMVAKNHDSPYSKILAWINKSNYFLYKKECYDIDSEELIKKIVEVDVKEIKGVLLSVRTVVDNLEGEHKTLLMREKPVINSGISDSVFTVKNLQK